MSKHSASIPLQENVPLAPLTTLGVGGPARFLVEASEEAHVSEGLEFAYAGGWPVFVLGGGSNILVSDAGFPGLVIRIALRGVRFEEEKSRPVVTAAAGEDWDTLVARCLGRNLAGIECLSGIPGTVGGTPVQNVGAYGQEVSDVIARVRILDRSTLRSIELSNAECGFNYRTSVFNTSQKDRYVVLSVSYSLHEGGEARVQYADLQRFFAGKNTQPSLAETRDAVLKIRAAKAMVLAPGDPDCKSAGSFFKNPLVSLETARRIEFEALASGRLAPSESLPTYSASGGMLKLPAAWLIERAGFHKGYSRGKVGLSSKHTLAIINRGGAKSCDIFDFMQEIKSGVRAAFGLDLIPEPVFVGF